MKIKNFCRTCFLPGPAKDLSAPPCSWYLVSNYQPTSHQTLRWKPEISHFTRYTLVSPVSDIMC